MKSFTCMTFGQSGNSKPLSTQWQFTCQLLLSVAKSHLFHFRSSSVANTSLPSPLLFISLSSQRLNLLVSLVFPFLFRFLPPAVGIPFQSTYKPRCSETGCPSSNTEFPTSTVHKSLFRRCFFPPTHLFLDVGPTTRQPLPLSAFWALYLPSPLPVGSRKASCSVLSFPLAIWISTSPFHSFLSHHLFLPASQP